MLKYNQNRPTRAEIRLSCLKNNYQILKKNISQNVSIMAVIKANAYGHGILEIANELVKYDVNYLGVAFLEEGIFLRNNGIKVPILVMGAIDINQIPLFIRYNIDITASSIYKLKAISKVAVKLNIKANVHLKIDTGMQRIGVRWDNANSFLNTSYSLPGISIKGVFSHFAKADSDYDFSIEQLKRFMKIKHKILKADYRPLFHMANSAGIVNIKESHLDMVRPGLMLYGYGSEKLSLKPVMNLKTKISYYKPVDKSTGISYNHTYHTVKKTRIITLPIGYGDGYSRQLSNKGKVALNGKLYPIVGNICMDQMMVDIGLDSAYPGDDILLFGKDSINELRLETLCESMNTIPYELLTMLNDRIPRIYVI